MTQETTMPKRKRGRPPLEFNVTVETFMVPCPPEHAWAYWHAWDLIVKAALRLKAEDGLKSQSAPTQ